MARFIQQVMVLVEEPHIKSLGHLVRLKQYYLSLINDGRIPSWMIHLNWRNDILMKLHEVGEPLTCVYCGAKNLLPFAKQKSRLVTFDHVIPRSRGGTSDLNNLVLSCSCCNGHKSNTELPPEKIATLRTLKHILGNWKSKISPR